MQIRKSKLKSLLPVTFSIMSPETAESFLKELPEVFTLHSIQQHILSEQKEAKNVPAYIFELALIESHAMFAAEYMPLLSDIPSSLTVNPTLALVETTTQKLSNLFDGSITPAECYLLKPGKEIVVIFMQPASRKLMIRTLTKMEMLALKIVLEDLSIREVAAVEKTTIAILDNALDQAVSRGLILKPPSQIKRRLSNFDNTQPIPEEFTTAETFTLQWHITQSCDLHCKHCYDRSQRPDVSSNDAEDIMDQLYDFCHKKHVHGQITFTGGNPLLHPHFFKLYQGATDRGFLTAILGNPTTREILEEIKAIQVPEFYQISLEGLEARNNSVRGKDHYRSAIEFLEILQAAGIYSMVMLTLTKDNMGDVLPLAEILREKTNLFTFNRLSTTGEGASLLSPSKEEYHAFLKEYCKAVKKNPILTNKDNMINILQAQHGSDIFGGCAGFGCGAAFNFVSLLSDGEVHACRKFHSPIGNIINSSLLEIYDNNKAGSYRDGPKQCRGCSIRHVCGGCLAVIESHGLDCTNDRDPCCFID